MQTKRTVLVLAVHEKAFYAEKSLKAGVLGSITKNEATANTLPVIRRVLSRKVYLTGGTARQVRVSLAPVC